MPCNKEKGFTLIELITVLVIMGIVMAIALSRGTSTADADLRAKTEALKSHIRYVQMRSMNMTPSNSACNAPFGITASSNPYYMFRDCNTANQVTLPGADGPTVSLSGVTISAANAPNNIITFDEWGRPCTDLQGSTIAAANIVLTLSKASATPQTITITRNTGYVP